MSTFDRAAPFAAALSLPARRAPSAGPLTWLLRWRDEARAVEQLERMSDRQLHDIGLAREQIRAAVRSGRR